MSVLRTSRLTRTMTTVIDHVIWGTRDLATAGQWFWSEHGLASYEGGAHPAYGTGNRIIPLGDSYIELMGIVDEATARSNPLGQYVLQQIDGGDRWIAWCLRSDDIDALAARIGAAPVAGERHTPDGRVVSWRSTGLELALTQPPLPFFIAWDDLSVHPGRTPLGHRRDVSGIRNVHVTATEIEAVTLLGTSGQIVI